MRVREVDTRSMLNAIPYPAMLLDEHHRVVDANTLMARTAGWDGTCGLDCFSLVHGSDEPPKKCPLDIAVRTGAFEVSTIEDERNGCVRVSVSPLDFSNDLGDRIYLHVMTAD